MRKEAIKMYEKIRETVDPCIPATAYLTLKAMDKAAFYGKAKENEKIRERCEEKIHAMMETVSHKGTLPSSLSDLSAESERIRAGIIQRAGKLLEKEKTSVPGKIFAWMTRPVDGWKVVIDTAGRCALYIEAVTDFAEDDDIEDAPMDVFVAYDELRDIDYLCRVMSV